MATCIFNSANDFHINDEYRLLRLKTLNNQNM